MPRIILKNDMDWVQYVFLRLQVLYYARKGCRWETMIVSHSVVFTGSHDFVKIFHCPQCPSRMGSLCIETLIHLQWQLCGYVAVTSITMKGLATPFYRWWQMRPNWITFYVRPLLFRALWHNDSNRDYQTFGTSQGRLLFILHMLMPVSYVNFPCLPRNSLITWSTQA